MRVLSLLVLAQCISAVVALRNVVGLNAWDGWTDTIAVDWSGVTHLLYSGVTVMLDGTLIFDNPDKSLGPFHALGELGGQLGVVHTTKTQNRGVKTGLTVSLVAGGVEHLFQNHTLRSLVNANVVALIEDLGLDFIHFPWGTNYAHEFITIIPDLRAAMKKLPYKTELGVGASGDDAAYFGSPAMCDAVDFVSVSAWFLLPHYTDVAGHLGGLFTDLTAPAVNQKSVDNVMQAVKAQSSCKTDKFVVSTSNYAAIFSNSSGLHTQGNPMSLYDSRYVPMEFEAYDPVTKASYAYTPSRLFFSYESRNSTKAKARYVQANGFGGMSFVYSTPFDGAGRGGLVAVPPSVLGSAAFDFSLNNVDYPNSKYSNVRKGVASTISPTTKLPAC